MEGKPKQVNYTRVLKNALAAGAVIECAVGRFERFSVIFDPRSTNDPKPWALTDCGNLDDYRYSGRECRVRREENA